VRGKRLIADDVTIADTISRRLWIIGRDCPPANSSCEFAPEGDFRKAPGYISPDAQTPNPDGSLKEQGWQNLRQAVHPLRVICRYGDMAVPVVLPQQF
jgi:hypothetical protein